MEFAQACDLLTGVVERAKLDARGRNSRGHAVKDIPGWCDCTTNRHPASSCAKQFLARLDLFVIENPQPSPSEIVQAILEVIE
jgi:hypothetical protein